MLHTYYLFFLRIILEKSLFFLILNATLPQICLRMKVYPPLPVTPTQIPWQTTIRFFSERLSLLLSDYHVSYESLVSSSSYFYRK